MAFHTHRHAGNKRDVKPSPTYKSWQAMLGRCYAQRNASFKNYGGKGITVSDAWKKFENFLSDMGERPIGMTLDRIDYERNYEKGNCRWATMKEQGNNRSTNNVIAFGGREMTLEQWADAIKVPSNALWMRLYRYHWSIDKALTTPLMRKHGRDTAHPRAE